MYAPQSRLNANDPTHEWKSVVRSDTSIWRYSLARNPPHLFNGNAQTMTAVPAASIIQSNSNNKKKYKV
jgi:hypothetical protein